jgi:hypothetical protein
MDELALLKGFRLEDASPDGARDHALAALRAAAGRARRTRRRTLIVLAFAGAAILAGAAYGVVRVLVVGDPAPEEVREQPARFGHSAELIPVPHPDDPRLEDARVAAVLDSSVGTVYLFASANARGLCASTWIEGDRGYQGRLNIGSVCGPSRQSFFAFGTQRYRGNLVQLFSGRAGDGVTRVALAFGRRLVTVPLTGRWFLAELAARPDAFLSYAADGRILERHPFLQLSPRPSTTAEPHEVSQLREVARIRARSGAEEVTLLVAPASDGGYCQVVRSDRTPTNRGCSVARPSADEIAVAAMNFGGAPGGILLLVGPVGSDVASLQLRYEDGRARTVPLHDGWALYEVDRADYAEGRRPERLVGRDAAGREVASERLPWSGSTG